MSIERDKPGRRSDTILQTRRQPLPWPDDAEFRILSIDGGGIKGIFPAAVLTHLEEICLDGQPIGDYFDLIAGTSTGGILALGLGAGLPARSLLDLYVNEGHRVFPRSSGRRAEGCSAGCSATGTTGLPWMSCSIEPWAT